MGARTERHYAMHDRPALSVPAQPYSRVHWCWHLTSTPGRKEGEGKGEAEGRLSSLFCPPQHFSLPVPLFILLLSDSRVWNFASHCLPALSSERGTGGGGERVGAGWEYGGLKSRHWRGGRQRCRRDGSLTTTCLIWTLVVSTSQTVCIAPTFANSWYQLSQSKKPTECLQFH